MEKKWNLIREKTFNTLEIKNFRSLAIKRDLSKDFIDWLYTQSPYGPAHVWFARINNEIIAQNSTLPYEVYISGKKNLASLNFDIATHPSYRFMFIEKKVIQNNFEKTIRESLFSQISIITLTEEFQENIEFMVGFPNDKAIPGHLQLGWLILGKRPIFEIENYSQIKLDDSNSYDIQHIDNFNNEFDDLMEINKELRPIIKNRSSLYLNWRFCKRPNTNYHCFKVLNEEKSLIAYFVLKVFSHDNHNTLDIIDFIIPENRKIFAPILTHILNFAKSQHINLIDIMINPTLEFTKYLLQIGFTEQKHNLFYTCFIKENSQFSAILKDIHNHYVTFSDSDVF